MIRLTDAAKFYRELPHQLAAWNALQESLTADQLRLFEETYRSGPQEKRTDLGPALQLIKEFEGCRLAAYPDPASGDEPWTIGYGTTRYPDGRKVGRGNKITVIEADLMLRMEVDRIAEVLRTTVPHWGEMNANQQSALVSFAYNLGAKFYGSAGFETISKLLADKRWDDVPAAMWLYRNPGTAVEAGLVRRRKAEGELWSTGKKIELQQDPAKLTPAAPFTARLTPHITLGEFALNQPERRFTAQHQIDAAAELAAFLERCRTRFGGKPVIITSGYRPPAVNRSVGGASQSEHLYDAKDTGAVDFYIDGVPVQAVQDWCDKEWPYSVGYGAPKGFVHLGIRPGRPRVRWDY